MTGADGYAALNDLKVGTKIKINKVTAPNGYVNKSELKEINIEPNKTIEVILVTRNISATSSSPGLAASSAPACSTPTTR